MSEWIKKRKRAVHQQSQQDRKETHRLNQKETCQQKKQYGSEHDAQKNCDDISTPYFCSHCSTWHLTTKVKKEENKNNFLEEMRGDLELIELHQAASTLRRLFFLAQKHGHGPKTKFEEMSTFLNDLSGKY